MGLLSSIKSAASKVISSVKSVITPSKPSAPVVNKVVQIATPPKTALTPSLPKSSPAPSASISSKVVSAVKNVLTYDIQKELKAEGSTKEVMYNVMPPVSTAGVALVTPNLLSKFIPKSLLGKIGVGLGAPVVVSTIIKSPEIRQKIFEAPQDYFTAVGDISTDITKVAKGKYGFDDAIAFIKAHPYLTAATAAAALAVAGYSAVVISNVISNYYQKKAAEKFLEEDTPEIPAGSIPTDKPELPPEKELKTDEGKAVTPTTQTINTGRKRYRKAKAKEKTSVRQNVQLIIHNRNSADRITKNYLKEAVLYN